MTTVLGCLVTHASAHQPPTAHAALITQYVCSTQHIHLHMWLQSYKVPRFMVR